MLYVYWTFLDSDFQLNANDDCDLGIRSLGAIIWYLKQCKFDYQLLTRGRFEIFKPIDVECIDTKNHDNIKIKHMVILKHALILFIF